MRIALFSEWYTPTANGVVTSLITLRQVLQEWGHRVYLFAPGTPQADDDGDVVRLRDLPFPKHPYHFARPFVRPAVDFARLDLDLVHCQHPFTVGRLGADVASRQDLPMVYTAHSLYDAMAEYLKPPLAREMGSRMARNLIRRFCARADCVIAPSEHTKQALLADGVEARFEVIPSGAAPLAASPNARQRIRNQLGIHVRTPLLLYVGRLGPEKRIDILLRAVQILMTSKLAGTTPGLELAIVGDGQCRTSLEELAAGLNVTGIVRFIGQQPHDAIGDWCAAADVFVLPSPVETQGLVLVEAMSAGLPCIAVNCGGPSELIIPGETGLLTPADAEAIAEAIRELSIDADLRRRMGDSGRNRAKLFSPEAMTKQVLAVYESVVGSR